MRQTTIENKASIKKKWFLIDANDKVLGRVASLAASILRGKTKKTFTPHVDMGDNLVIVNAEKIKLTANKEENKLYYSYSGYRGGLKTINAKELRKRKPTALVEKAIKGMLPHTKLGKKQFLNLHVYAGSEHKQEAQNPITIKVVK